MVSAMDEAVRNITKALEDEDMHNSTILLFTTDVNEKDLDGLDIFIGRTAVKCWLEATTTL